METVAIFGVGLIGGSFALAIRKAGFTGRIIGVSSDQTIRAALDAHIIDEALPAREAAGKADLVYLSQPIHKIVDCLEELDAWVQPSALITDVGSTKKLIVQTADQKITRARFLGGHPMAGRERRGVEAAEADLFQGRPYVLTPRSPADLEHPAAREFLDWIPRIGSSPSFWTRKPTIRRWPSHRICRNWRLPRWPRCWKAVRKARPACMAPPC